MDRATRREQRIRHLEENVAKLRAEQNRLKALTSKEQRKIETRRNILAGVDDPGESQGRGVVRKTVLEGDG